MGLKRYDAVAANKTETSLKIMDGLGTINKDRNEKISITLARMKINRWIFSSKNKVFSMDQQRLNNGLRPVGIGLQMTGEISRWCRRRRKNFYSSTRSCTPVDNFKRIEQNEDHSIFLHIGGGCGLQRSLVCSRQGSIIRSPPAAQLQNSVYRKKQQRRSR